MIPENATLFSIFLLGKGIHEKTPCDVTACRREYLRTALRSEERLDRRDRLGARMSLEFYPQCELRILEILLPYRCLPQANPKCVGKGHQDTSLLLGRRFGLEALSNGTLRDLRQYLLSFYRFRLHHSDIYAYGEKGDPLHYATSCHMTLSHHFTKPTAENTQLWWTSLLSNKLSRINIAKHISFLTENENLIKQPPDATSSSDSTPDFSPSPRPQTYGLRPSRGSIPRTLISHPTSFCFASFSFHM
ncbi:hypothetical protein AVEN_171276-1 [Araneus ventricosus]|uniref:Uncharacterized protein n=1 Tax=Araneus ventricosus TaxID=182803 RepID=A0A4Y2WNE3_ARAVE|nr:hypothetical protein AVEN_171276-1 [Araneus ventricosus]